MNIVYFAGGRRERVLLRIIKDRRFKVVCIVIARSECYKGIYSAIAGRYKIRLKKVTKKEIIKSLYNLKADIFLSVGFRYILPKKALRIAAYNINVHPTLLPKYKGAYSGNYILINNEKKTGITVHHMEEKADEGDIILKRTFPLSVFDTAKSLARKTYAFEPEVVVQALMQLKNKKSKRIKQKKCKYVFKDRIPEDSRLNPNKPLISLFNLIRASDADKYPAFFYFKGEKIAVKLERLNKPRHEQDMI